MITLVIFTFKRTDRLLKCLQTIDSKNVNEILIFNDDESSELSLNKLGLDNKIIRIFNPSDWGFSGRKFRKPIYLNKAIEMAKNDKILFSDDDGKFSKGTIDLHHDTLDKFRFTANAVVGASFRITCVSATDAVAFTVSEIVSGLAAGTGEHVAA